MIKTYKLEEMSESELAFIKKRSGSDIDKVKSRAASIIIRVRKEGDKALVYFAKKFDDPSFEKSRLAVTYSDIKEAYRNTDKETIRLIKEQIRLSKKFHDAQLKNITMQWEEQTAEGVIVGEKWKPIGEVGLYVPGGKNPFPTVQQILAVPAKLAGCERIISCISPKGKNYEVIIAANECNIREIYRVSGAAAIAAMAYGTETIAPVDLVAGPGNPFVTAAKILCQERIAIDMPAGPSEAIILADKSRSKEMDLKRKAEFCAADILARAEHGYDSSAVLVTDSKKLARLVKKEVGKQFKLLSRKEFAKSALSGYSAIIIAKDMDDAIEFANEYAPEHLEIMTKDPRKTLEKIRNAGSVFLGRFNPVAVGDYASGVNHILPTCGWAKKSSPVGVLTFMKRMQYSIVSKQGLEGLMPIISRISDVEGLDAHKKSAKIRLNGDDKNANKRKVRI